jgi:hypothetical protein
VQGYPLSFDQALGSLNIIGRRRMIKSFKFQAIVLKPLAGPYV